MASGSTTEQRLLGELLARCAERDEAALAEFYRLTSPLLRAVARRRVRRRREVDPALVKVYVTIWREADVYAELPDTSAWEWTLMILTRTLAPPVRPVGRRLARAGG